MSLIVRRRDFDSTPCYLCGEPIGPTERDRDHVPPKRFFAKAIRKQYNPQLQWLHTHRACQAAFKADEEYFTSVFALHSPGSSVADAVLDDWKRGLQKGHDQGLYRLIGHSFGQVQLPDGRLLFTVDVARVRRVIWKFVRGVFTLMTGRFLPEFTVWELTALATPSETKEKLDSVEWAPTLINTASLGKYARVFDVKALCGFDGMLRMWFLGFLFWDRTIVLVRFHDPTCQCADCKAEISPSRSRAPDRGP